MTMTHLLVHLLWRSETAWFYADVHISPSHDNLFFLHLLRKILSVLEIRIDCYLFQGFKSWFWFILQCSEQRTTQPCFFKRPWARRTPQIPVCCPSPEDKIVFLCPRGQDNSPNHCRGSSWASTPWSHTGATSCCLWNFHNPSESTGTRPLAL